MAQLEKTKAGLEPDLTELQYRIETKDVEEHLQKAINLLVRDIREKEREKGNDGRNVKDIKITVLTNPIAKQFRPFIIALPIDSAVKGRRVNDSDSPSIYHDDGNDRNFQLHDWLYKFLSAFTYNKNDISAFDSVSFRRELGLTPAAANTMKQYARPRVHSTREDKKPTHIVLYLDPLRVFKNMLRVTPDERFKVLIKKSEIKDLNVGESAFKVIKVSETGGSKSNERQKLQKLITKNINTKRG